MPFCKHCGKELQLESGAQCPYCGKPTDENPAMQSTASAEAKVVRTAPYKSPGTAALIAFLGGIFGLPGIGHIYVGRLKRGILILISGIALYIVASVALIVGIGFIAALDESGVDLTGASLAGAEPDLDLTGASLAGAGAVIFALVLFIVYLVLWIWQIFDARNLARKFNEHVKQTGEEPW